MRKNLDLLSLLGHQGGVHNSYLTLWFNAGIIGIIIFFRSFFLLFFKANRFVPVSFAIMFSVMFSVMYESWLMGSLNPYTIVLVMAMTITTEPEMQAGDPLEDAEERWAPEPEDPDRRYF